MHTWLSTWLCIAPLALGESGESPEHAPKTRSALSNSIGMKLVELPPGEFWMGAGETEAEATGDERPRHRVRITRPFYLGVYEVTQGEFERVTARQGSFFSPTGPGKAKIAGLDSARLPAEQVTWHAAIDFCKRLSALPEERKARRVYRLPSEAEWEYACRAGTETPFHVGASLAASQANFNGKHPYGGAAEGPFLARTAPVGSFKPNAFGLYDMHGNVWEWCADWYAADYYKHSPTDDPPGPAKGSSRVIRGGCWYSDARDCRSAFRYAELPSGTFYVMGFRVAMDVGASRPNAESTGKVRAAQTTSGPSRNNVDSAVEPKSKTPAITLGEDWPRWRGPRGDGTWRGPKLPEKWPAGGLKRLWRQPVGGGYAGVVGAQGRVYTLDFQKKGASTPREKQDPSSPEAQPTAKPYAGHERVLCFDAETGKPLWSHAYQVHHEELSYGNGPRAAPTLHDGRIYALGAIGRLFCLEAATGKVAWSKDLVKEFGARVPMWGLSASPVVYDDLVIVHAGAKPDGCLIAFDRRTGVKRWGSLSDDAGYATPILIQHAGQPQLVCWTPSHIRGVDPRDGKPLWNIRYEVTYGTAIATPIFQEGIVLVSGYWEGAKAIRLADQAAAAKSAKPPRGSPAAAELLWEDNRNLRALMSQPLYRDGLAFLLDKRHGLTCFELKSGNKLWDDDNRMTPKGRNPQASMVWLGDGDRAIILNSDGELILARLNREGYQEQSRTNIIGPTWAHPAYMGNRVFARSDSEVVCVELPTK
jgi:outer membrane protein assembly factor BamB